MERHETIPLEGHRVVPVEVGQSDAYATTVLHIPSIGLVIAGDVVYGSYFQYLVESKTAELQQQWRDSIEKVSKLQNVEFVVASHMQESDGFGYIGPFEEDEGVHYCLGRAGGKGEECGGFDEEDA